VALRNASEEASALGSVGPRGSLRILGINDIDVDAPLEGVVLFIHNQDVPGVIGRLGTLLGEREINIANFALGRNPAIHEAIGLVNVDHDIPHDVLAEIRHIPAIKRAQLVKVG
jgi:D-3-phosphoglycerate dehydrogenase